MKKIIITLALLSALTAGAFGQTINEFGITVEYEITEQKLIAIFTFDGLTDKYKIHILMDNELDSYGRYVLIDYYYNNGFRNTLYNLLTNSIESCCGAILYDLNNARDRFVVNSRIRNKSNEIVVLIRRLLVEALETGKMNLSD